METLWTPIGPGLWAPVLAWLGTYLVHSTLLLGAAWGVGRWLRRRERAGGLALEERLWKAALVGGLLTAGLQVGLGALPHPLVATVSLPAVAAPAASSISPAAGGPAAGVFVAAPSPIGAVSARGAGRPDPRLASLAALLPGWQRLTLAGWLAGAWILSLVLVVSWIRLRLSLRRRRDVGSGPARRALDRLLARSGTRRVRLTGTGRLPVPVALGVGEREICLPRRALEELDGRQQEGLVAHELAHLERWDPVWLLAARALENLLFFQPLNRLARRRLQEISEYRCDAWAVAATGDRLSLARSLTEVAGWLTDRCHTAPVPGMARGRRNLGDRVRRILEPSAVAGDDRTSRRRAILALSVALPLTALLAPGMSPARLAVETPPATPAAPGAAADPVGAEPPAAPAAEEVAPAARPDEPEAAPDRNRGEDEDLDRPEGRDLSGEIDPEELAAAVARVQEAVPDPAALAELERRIEHAVQQVTQSQSAALAAQRQAMEELQRELDRELAAVPEGRELTSKELQRLHGQLRELAEQARSEAEAAQPSEAELSELRELSRQLAAEARPDTHEIERMNREIQQRVRAEVEHANREMERTSRELREEMLRRTRTQQSAARRQVEQQMEAARRQIEAERQELERQRDELERQRRQFERQRERERERVRQERREGGESSPPPTS